MKAEIIAIGSEILLGETIDTNSAYLARQLAGLGVSLYRKAVVGDNEERIATMIREALDRVDLVICTGGLGPTADDVTREAVARATNRPLEFHQFLLDQIEARFRAFGRTMSPSNRRQAYVPAGARIVENPRGTAPSFIVDDPHGTVVVLPGVPSEMRYLWENAIAPYLRDERGQTAVILVKTLHAVGAGESVIGELLEDLMLADNPTLGISAKRAQYELRIGARGNSLAEAEALIAQATNTIQARLGHYLIGDEKVDQQVLRTLRERELQLALYEGATKAPFYQTLLASNGLDRVQSVTIAAPSADPTASAAEQQALDLLATSGAAFSVVLLPASLPGDDGFTQVVMAIAHAGTAQSWVRGYDLSLDDNWGFIATSAFDALRRVLGEG
jgi:competence/damage-inducible protein CinA-like protein